MVDGAGSGDDGLLEILLERVEQSELSPDQQLLVLAAYEGDIELQQALSGHGGSPPGSVNGDERGVERAHAYLRAVTVRGFRGVGTEATLRLPPKPGLTLVVGRNGSGKSSLAEAIEAALTGTSYRWKDKTQDWKSGWRNLHESDHAAIRLELALDGERGPTVVERTWPGENVDDSECWSQRSGRPRQPLAALGWDVPLTTHRPFLSYAELGQRIVGRPSEMYEALASILGLDLLTDAEKRLAETRKRLDSAAKEVDQDLAPLLKDLEDLDDDRAREAHAALSGRVRDMGRASDIASGTTAEGDESSRATLMRLSSIEVPDEQRVREVAAELREAFEASQSFAGTDAEVARQTASLLQAGLEYHDRHRDHGDCPVCGTERVLDEAWGESARARMEQLRRTAQAATDAEQRVHKAAIQGRALLTSPPAWLPTDVPIRAAWTVWASGSDLQEPVHLADHLEQAFPTLTQAATEAHNVASQRLQEIEDRWRPIALRLSAWIERAKPIEADSTPRADIKAAHEWLRNTGLNIRNDRLRPLAERSTEIWHKLRQESNVNLGPIRLAGKGNRRSVSLDVTVDGAEGSALGVMSQGELHALGLALFLPRATMPESPFGFIVIDDPVQSMDPAKVDGLARVLVEAATSRQVLVFTHDARLPDALRRLALPATVWEVIRRENSEIELCKLDDPATRALKDAHSLLRTDNLPPEVAARVVPGLCRTAVEAALVDLIWRRRLAAGDGHAAIADAVMTARSPYQLAAIGYLGDSSKAGEVLRRINRYGSWAGDAFMACKEGGHVAYQGDLRALIESVNRLVGCIGNER